MDIRLGKSKSAEEVNLENLKGGIRKEDVSEEYRSIFDALDTNDKGTKGILEDSEINTLKGKIKEFAKNNIFSKREVGKLLKSLGLNGINAETFFGFIKNVLGLSEKIKSSTTDDSGNTSVTTEDDNTETTTIYDKTGKANTKTVTTKGNNPTTTEEILNENGKATQRTITTTGNPPTKTVETLDDKGTTTAKTVQTLDTNGNPIETTKYELQNGKLVQTAGTTKDGKSFTRKYDTDGNYTDTYDNRNEMTFDKDGKLISGKSNGVSFKAKTIVYENGNEVSTRFYADNNNSIEVYKNGKFVSGRNGDYDPQTYIVRHNDDGTITKLYTSGDSEICKYDKNGNLLSLNKYDPDGNRTDSTVYKYENGNLILATKTNVYGEVATTEYTYDGNGNLTLATKTNVNGEVTTTEYTYDESGNLTLETNKNEENNITGSIKYTYENGNLKTKEELNSNNELENKFTYNESGDLVSKDTYSIGDDGKRYISVAESYENGMCVSEQYFNEAGGKEELYKYEYDEIGNTIKGQENDVVTFEREYDPDTNLLKLERNYQDGELYSTDEYIYNDNGRNKIMRKQTIEGDNNVYYIDPSSDDPSIKMDEDGNIKMMPQEGLNFDQQMEALGITDDEDKEAFKAANPEAANRRGGGYFLVGEFDINIPKALADKLGISSNLDKHVTSQFNEEKNHYIRKAIGTTELPSGVEAEYNQKEHIVTFIKNEIEINASEVKQLIEEEKKDETE